METLDAINIVQANLRMEEQVGIDEVLRARFRADEAYRTRMGKLARQAGLPARDGVAPSFGGGNVFATIGLEDWQQLFVMTPTEPMQRAQTAWPWNNGLPGDLRLWPDIAPVETHFCFLGASEVNGRGGRDPLKLTLPGLRHLVEQRANWRNQPPVVSGLFTTRPPNPLVAEELAMIATPHNEWYMMPVVPYLGAKVPAGYELASAAEYLLGMILYYQKYSRFAEVDGVSAQTHAVRCSDTGPFTGSPRLQLTVRWPRDGFVVEYCHEDEPNRPNVGLALKLRKPSSRMLRGN